MKRPVNGDQYLLNTIVSCTGTHVFDRSLTHAVKVNTMLMSKGHELQLL